MLISLRQDFHQFRQGYKNYETEAKARTGFYYVQVPLSYVLENNSSPIHLESFHKRPNPLFPGNCTVHTEPDRAEVLITPQ